MFFNMGLDFANTKFIPSYLIHKLEAKLLGNVVHQHTDWQIYFGKHRQAPMKIDEIVSLEIEFCMYIIIALGAVT